jgi:hypothetical protein
MSENKDEESGGGRDKRARLNHETAQTSSYVAGRHDKTVK